MPVLPRRHRQLSRVRTKSGFPRVNFRRNPVGNRHRKRTRQFNDDRNGAIFGFVADRNRGGWGTFGGVCLLPRQSRDGMADRAGKKGPPQLAWGHVEMVPS